MNSTFSLIHNIYFRFCRHSELEVNEMSVLAFVYAQFTIKQVIVFTTNLSSVQKVGNIYLEGEKHWNVSVQNSFSALSSYSRDQKDNDNKTCHWTIFRARKMQLASSHRMYPTFVITVIILQHLCPSFANLERVLVSLLRCAAFPSHPVITYQVSVSFRLYICILKYAVRISAVLWIFVIFFRRMLGQ
jgi:hypothetical protein